MDVHVLRYLLGLSEEQLARAIGLEGSAGAQQVANWEPGEPSTGPAAVALTYLAQGALAERAGVPEFLVAGDETVGGQATFVLRSWRPRFLAMVATVDTALMSHQSWVWVERDAFRLVVLQWWDDPLGCDITAMLERAAKRLRPAVAPIASLTPHGLPPLATEDWSACLRSAPGFAAHLWGPEHVYNGHNDDYVRLLGQRDYFNRPVQEAVPEAEGQGFFELLAEVYRTGETVRVSRKPLFVRSDTGLMRERVIDFSYAATFNRAGDPSGIMAQGIDVTEWVRAETALAELQSRLGDHALRNA